MIVKAKKQLGFTTKGQVAKARDMPTHVRQSNTGLYNYIFTVGTHMRKIFLDLKTKH